MNELAGAGIALMLIFAMVCAVVLWAAVAAGSGGDEDE